jgi:glycosyltransferase involved in cell wall biosynthesis
MSSDRKKVKILHLIDSGGLYGAEMMLLSLAAAQEKMGLQPVIGSIRKTGIGEKPLDREARRRGLLVKVFEMRPGPNLRGVWGIVRYARKNHFDLFHSHGYKTNILFGLMPRFFHKLPIVTTLHGWTSTGGWTKKHLNEILDAFSLRFVDKIVLVNRRMLEKPKVKRLPIDKICIIDNGIEIEYKKNPENANLDKSVKNQLHEFCLNGKIVASIGRLSREKGFDYLIEAIRILRQEQNENIRLLLIGDGCLRRQLKQQARDCGIEKYFLITGYIKNARNLHGLFDCYVISSLTEGLPITLLEAMASGTPIVATAVGGIPNVVTDRKEALIVPPKDPQALARAIWNLLEDSQLSERIATRAAIRVQTRYSSSIMTEKYRDLYKAITGA